MKVLKHTPERPASAAVEAVGAPPPRILIVEDEWMLAFATETALQDAGCAVVGTASTAEAALDLAEAHRPDLVLMDVDLRRNRDGIDAAIDIWNLLGIRSLFLSGRSDPATRRRAEAAQPFGWIAKPCVGEALIGAIHDALQKTGKPSAASG